MTPEILEQLVKMCHQHYPHDAGKAFEKILDTFKTLCAEENQANIEIAKIQAEARLEMFKSVLESGRNAIKASLVMNGGAAVALLTFIGHLATKTPPLPIKIDNLAAPETFFGIGVLLAVIAHGTVYFAQKSFHHDKVSKGECWNWVTIFLVCLGLLRKGGQ